MKKEEETIIKKNTILTIIMNTLLAIAKIIGGVLGGSAVLVADGIQSVADIATNIVVFISAIFSKKDKDKTHPYGHEKFDSMVSIFLGFALLITAFQLGKDAAVRFYEMVFENAEVIKPMWYTWVIALMTIVVKELLFRKTTVDAKKARSQALMAQAWDHRSDTIVSFGSIIGIVGAIYGIGFLDPLASMVIALFIFRLGYKIIKTGVSQVIDESANDEQISKIKELVNENDKVRSIDEIKTRMFGLSIYVDLEISLDAHLSLEKAHQISEDIHDYIEKEMPDVIHCMIHVNPHEEGQNQEN
ncbi:MAG: cation diffusion facilitator family transporter [Tenericutes bacterium]|jgi:cation diffusion facilitator family transporter|nr:cation diffusion facilitator family transporter [Mycoplasmatota bacterium]